MDELATGGPVDPENLPRISEGCDYVIPRAWAKRWAAELLEEINQSKLDKPGPV